ncbi:hypothetical protein GE061_013117 [Apolygus lucorum]|uniref:Uncharacterized protein n=1 Tax=Apolygus lucorum TaxID=248454 RepID=A0A8S9XW99_APOLU|nr:hypothetical protein GE061_013117 [Apolygus lucorum]
MRDRQEGSEAGGQNWAREGSPLFPIGRKPVSRLERTFNEYTPTAILHYKWTKEMHHLHNNGFKICTANVNMYIKVDAKYLRPSSSRPVLFCEPKGVRFDEDPSKFSYSLPV